MKLKTYKIIRLIILFFVSIATLISLNLINPIFMISSILLGKIILIYSKSKLSENITDERTVFISHQAASITYIVTTIVISLISLLFIFLSKMSTEKYFLETLGTILAYITCFIILTYSVLYKFFSKKFGD